jgi:hypothetical protein
MNLRPIKDQIVVLPDPPVKTFGLIEFPDAVLAENPNYFSMTGVVVKLGDGIQHHTFECINCGTQTYEDEGKCPGCRQTLAQRHSIP